MTKRKREPARQSYTKLGRFASTFGPYAYAMSFRLSGLVLLAFALVPAAAAAQTPPPIVVADPLSGKFSEHPAEIAFRDTFFAKVACSTAA